MSNKFYIGLLSLLFINLSYAVEFSIYTHNILGPNTQDVQDFAQKGDYARLNEVVKKAVQSQATFLCFQEWDSNTWSSLSSNIQNLLRTNYEVVSSQSKGQNGGVILYIQRNNPNIKMLDKKALVLGQGSNAGACAYGFFEINNTPVVVASIHLSRPNFSSGTVMGDQQIDQLMSDLSQKGFSGAPIVLAGDFNTFYSEVLSHTISKYRLSMYEHRSWTVMNKNKEFSAIDHVLYSDPSLRIDIAKSWVGNVNNPYFDQNVPGAQRTSGLNLPAIHQAGYNSDHLPVFVTFSLVNSGNQLSSASQAASTALSRAGQSGAAQSSAHMPFVQQSAAQQASLSSFNIENWLRLNGPEIKNYIRFLINNNSGYEIRVPNLRLGEPLPWGTLIDMLPNSVRINLPESDADLVQIIQAFNKLFAEIKNQQK